MSQVSKELAFLSLALPVFGRQIRPADFSSSLPLSHSSPFYRHRALSLFFLFFSLFISLSLALPGAGTKWKMQIRRNNEMVTVSPVCISPSRTYASLPDVYDIHLHVCMIY